MNLAALGSLLIELLTVFMFKYSRAGLLPLLNVVALVEPAAIIPFAVDDCETALCVAENTRFLELGILGLAAIPFAFLRSILEFNFYLLSWLKLLPLQRRCCCMAPW